MVQRPDPKELKMSLLSGDAAARQAVLERMRGKLAGRSTDLMAKEEVRRKVVFRKRFAWGWRAGLTALFLVANAFLVMHFKPEARTMAKAAKTAPVLVSPKTLSVNDQALYWTYALYDFDRLAAKFGVPAGTVVSAPDAKANLTRLLPKVDARTRFAIEQYLPKQGRRT